MKFLPLKKATSTFSSLIPAANIKRKWERKRFGFARPRKPSTGDDILVNRFDFNFRVDYSFQLLIYPKGSFGGDHNQWLKISRDPKKCSKPIWLSPCSTDHSNFGQKITKSRKLEPKIGRNKLISVCWKLFNGLESTLIVIFIRKHKNVFTSHYHFVIKIK